MIKKETDWFQAWFDTPYYHQLYDHRNETEAEGFMLNLIDFLQLKQGSKILDLPCGRGRHAIFLNKCGYDVVGADLSANNIAFANEFANGSLRFTQHDMRQSLNYKYKAIFNLFTSFGYFDEDETNIEVLKKFKEGLEEDGILVIDFLNINKIRKKLITTETVQKEDILFKISRAIQKEQLVKTIEFEADEQQFCFAEKVRSFSFEDFERMSSLASLEIIETFGNYDLEPFNHVHSDRLILLLK
ncbi:SAM-dependent methyltransferase [Namhaeicola litoreus]|uniref:SAM-dependent methyltransferase n=1 Tax=Namhaeicola litoreus TaxID=1052145 RepID=A0ABW3Y3F2_9FLAO